MASYYGGTQLNREQVAQIAYQAGFRGDLLAQMVGIAMRESSGWTGAHRTVAAREALSGDRGLWQVNAKAWDQTLIQAGIIQQASDLLDPVTNARAAFYIHQKQGLNAWAVTGQKINGSYWNAAGNPMHGVNLAAAQNAVQTAASKGLLGADWNQGSGSGSGEGGGGSAMALPSDARLVANQQGLFALFKLADGLWIHYGVPNDMQVSGSIERLSNQQYLAKYGQTVGGGSAKELDPVRTGYGTYQRFWNSIVDQVLGLNNPARNDRDVLRVLAEFAGRPDMSREELSNKLEGTKWWQARTKAELEWSSLSPAEQELRRRDTASRMTQTWFQFAGEQVDANDPRVRQHLDAVASGKMGFGQWTENFLKPRALQNRESPWARQVRDEQEAQRQRGVDVENTVNAMRQTLVRWGLKWDEKTMFRYAQQLMERKISDDDLNKVIRDAAQALYPWKDPMQETIVAAAPWIETYNRVMEQQGSLETGRIAKALRAGQDVWDFEQELKQSEDWLSTGNARDEMYQTTSEMGRLMGFV